VPKFREEKRDRWLSTEEIERVCDALDHHSNQSAANAIRLMLLTGARRGEVLTAAWEDFNLELGVWTKPSHHTKQKRTEHVPLSPPAVQLLASMKEKSASGYIFPGNVPGKPLREIKKVWATVSKQAKIESVRLHDLRDTYASHMVSSGMSLPIVGRLLGHTQPQTTARYPHLAARTRSAGTSGPWLRMFTGRDPRANGFEPVIDLAPDLDARRTFSEMVPARDGAF
jgi:integrase